ncbi:MAG: tetratricopeptide repeat protein [Nitrospirae bacterium]|nr:tetratricopeptide repeat protein [Nitrospirota bacterium]
MTPEVDRELHRGGGLVAVSAIGASLAVWLSIPSEGELAFMRYKAGQFADAEQTYQRRIADGDASVAVLVPLVHIYLDKGEADRAVALMETYLAAHPDDMKGHELLATANWQAGRLADYQRQLEILNGASPTPARLRELAGLYGHHGDSKKQFQALQRLAGAADITVAERIQLAHLQLRQGDAAAAARSLGTLTGSELAPLDVHSRTTHFQVLLALGRLDQAAQALTGFAADPAAAPVLFNDLANAYAAAQRAADGLRPFAYFRAVRPLPEVEGAWARLAATARREAEVMTWLTTQGPLGRPLLEDLYHIASDSNQTQLAVASAQRLFDQAPALETQRRLAMALLAAGRDDHALIYLRELVPDDPRMASLYVTTLQRLGEHAELGHYLRARLAGGQASEDDRRKTAFDLLAQGQRDAALEIFLSLAEAHGPDHPDVRELFFLWGPRPGDAALAWVQRRAEHAAGPERIVWLQHLMDLGGGAERVARMFEAGPPPGGAAATDIYLQALVATNNHARLADLLRDLLPHASDPARLRRYAGLAQGTGDTALAGVAYARLLSAVPDDGEALRWMGLAALSRQDHKAAAAYLERYLQGGPADLEAAHAMATALTNLGDDRRAAAYYRRTLELAEAQAVPGYAARLAVAASLDRLGRVAEAVAAYEQLHQDFPDDAAMLGEYAAMLYRNGLLERLRQVTAAR